MKRFRAKVDPVQLHQPWHAQFVMSTEPASQLPRALSSPGVRTVCIVEANIGYTKRIVKNGHWWNLSRRHELAVIDVKIIPGSADLKFEVWNDGRRLGGTQDQVEVRWENKLRSPTLADYSPRSGTSVSTSRMTSPQIMPSSRMGSIHHTQITTAGRSKVSQLRLMGK